MVIASSEHASSGIQLSFFDSSASRMDMSIDELTETLAEDDFGYFEGKPKVFIVYVSLLNTSKVISLYSDSKLLTLTIQTL